MVFFQAKWGGLESMSCWMYMSYLNDFRMGAKTSRRRVLISVKEDKILSKLWKYHMCTYPKTYLVIIFNQPHEDNMMPTFHFHFLYLFLSQSTLSDIWVYTIITCIYPHMLINEKLPYREAAKDTQINALLLYEFIQPSSIIKLIDRKISSKCRNLHLHALMPRM